MKNCPNCGAENPDDAAFCSNCAYGFQAAPPAGQPPYQQPPGQPPYPAYGQPQPYPPPGYQPYPPGYPTYAGFWIRFGAAFIDGIILSVAFFPINIIFAALSERFSFWGGWGGGGTSIGLVILYNILRVGVGWAYFTIMTGRYGATLGKMLLKLKVVREDMGPVSYGTAALREIVGKFVSSLVCGLGYIWVGFDDRKQAWHDKIAHTFVIRTGP
jgi:uncharacterized RDD family membrane protein YckC